MGALYADLGFIRYPITFAFLAVLLLACWCAWRLVGPRSSADARTKAWVDAILFWGAFAMISGVLGTIVGIILAAQAIEAAGSVSTTLLWGGIKIALLSSALGFLILAFASLVWFALQLRWRLLVAARA